MSASSKKKIRKEQNADLMTDRQKKEQAEAKSVKRLTVIFCIVMVAIVAAFLITNLIGSINRSGVIEKNTIAATVGDHKLNSVVMNYYFYGAVNSMYNNIHNSYGDYADSYIKYTGLDLSKPLDEQTYDEETGKTWADYFWDSALETAKSDYALYDLAVAENFEMPEDVQTSIDNTLMNVQLYAAYSGLNDTDAYLRNVYGNGSTLKNYEEFLNVSYLASSYYEAKHDSLEYDDAAIRAYEADRYDQYSAFTYATYTVNYSDFLTGGTTGEDGKTTYSDEEKDAARKAAEAAALSLTDATTVEEMNAAIAAIEAYAEKETKPTCSTSTDVMYTSLNEEQAKWMASDEREAGDVNVFPNTSKSTDADGKEIEVVNSYTVMMFLSRNENLEHLSNVRHILIGFKGGTKDDNGKTTYSDEEKAAAKQKAEDLLQQWKDGEATEESFIALVKDNTDDTASAETGGLYEDIHRDSNYVASFRDWATDSSRKAGDTGIVESDYGYHIMYYVGADELTYRDYLITQDMTNEDMEEWYDGVLENVTVIEGNTSRINKGLVYSAA